jgi:uncharacterized protein (DUF1778 family)
MSSTVKHHPYALRIPAPDAKALAKAQKISGQSINQLVMLCVRKALPDVLANFNVSRRVTNIAPLSTAELRRSYAGKDELSGITAKQLAAFQSQEPPE